MAANLNLVKKALDWSSRFVCASGSARVRALVITASLKMSTRRRLRFGHRRVFARLTAKAVRPPELCSENQRMAGNVVFAGSPVTVLPKRHHYKQRGSVLIVVLIKWKYQM